MTIQNTLKNHYRFYDHIDSTNTRPKDRLERVGLAFTAIGRAFHGPKCSYQGHIVNVNQLKTPRLLLTIRKIALAVLFCITFPLNLLGVAVLSLSSTRAAFLEALPNRNVTINQAQQVDPQRGLNYGTLRGLFDIAQFTNQNVIEKNSSILLSDVNSLYSRRKKVTPNCKIVICGSGRVYFIKKNNDQSLVISIVNLNSRFETIFNTRSLINEPFSTVFPQVISNAMLIEMAMDIPTPPENEIEAATFLDVYPQPFQLNATDLPVAVPSTRYSPRQRIIDRSLWSSLSQPLLRNIVEMGIESRSENNHTWEFSREFIGILFPGNFPKTSATLIVPHDDSEPSFWLIRIKNEEFNIPLRGNVELMQNLEMALIEIKLRKKVSEDDTHSFEIDESTEIPALRIRPIELPGYISTLDWQPTTPTTIEQFEALEENLDKLISFRVLVRELGDFQPQHVQLLYNPEEGTLRNSSENPDCALVLDPVFARAGGYRLDSCAPAIIQFERSYSDLLALREQNTSQPLQITGADIPSGKHALLNGTFLVRMAVEPFVNSKNRIVITSDEVNISLLTNAVMESYRGHANALANTRPENWQHLQVETSATDLLSGGVTCTWGTSSSKTVNLQQVAGNYAGAASSSSSSSNLASYFQELDVEIVKIEKQKQNDFIKDIKKRFKITEIETLELLNDKIRTIRSNNQQIAHDYNFNSNRNKSTVEKSQNELFVIKSTEFPFTVTVVLCRFFINEYAESGLQRSARADLTKQIFENPSTADLQSISAILRLEERQQKPYAKLGEVTHWKHPYDTARVATSAGVINFDAAADFELETRLHNIMDGRVTGDEYLFTPNFKRMSDISTQLPEQVPCDFDAYQTLFWIHGFTYTYPYQIEKFMGYFNGSTIDSYQGDQSMWRDTWKRYTSHILVKLLVLNKTDKPYVREKLIRILTRITECSQAAMDVVREVYNELTGEINPETPGFMPRAITVKSNIITLFINESFANISQGVHFTRRFLYQLQRIGYHAPQGTSDDEYITRDVIGCSRFFERHLNITRFVYMFRDEIKTMLNDPMSKSLVLNDFIKYQIQVASRISGKPMEALDAHDLLLSERLITEVKDGTITWISPELALYFLQDMGVITPNVPLPPIPTTASSTNSMAASSSNSVDTDKCSMV